MENSQNKLLAHKFRVHRINELPFWNQTMNEERVYMVTLCDRYTISV